MYKDEVAGLEECSTHNDILAIISKSVKEMLTTDKEANNGEMSANMEMLENSFMFFVAKISSKGDSFKADDLLYR